MALDPQKPLIGNDRVQNWLERGHRQTSAQRIVDSPDIRAEHSSKGVALFINKGTSGKQGWHWADPKEYDSITQYSEDEVIEVSPDNDAVVIGVETSVGDDPEFSVAGLFVCVKTPTWEDDPENPGSILVHIPRFPYPSSGVIYWKLISFYPMEIEVCETIDGVKTVRHAYANITPSF